MSKAAIVKSAIAAAAASSAAVWVRDFLLRYPDLPSEVATVVTVAVPAAVFLIVSLGLMTAYKTRAGRWLTLGRAWVEGWWLLVTFDEDGIISQEVPPGLMSIEYHGDDLELSVNVYRSTGSATGRLPVASRSISSSVRATDLQFINYCSFARNNIEERALGIGNFLLETGASRPSRYEGYLMRIGDRVYRRQGGLKIPFKKISEVKKKYDSAWMARLLEEMTASEADNRSAGYRGSQPTTRGSNAFPPLGAK